MDCVIPLRFFVFSFICCKYIVDIYLGMLDFNGLCKFRDILVMDYRRDSLAASQKGNDHMQVYIIIMESNLRLVLISKLSCKFNNKLGTSI